MKALLVIDVQNDYFAGGKLPLWNTETTLNNIKSAVREAVAKQIPVIFIQRRNTRSLSCLTAVQLSVN